MKYSQRYLIPLLMITLGMFNWSCDDRVPDDSTAKSNAQLTITGSVAISDIDPVTVGEVVSGYSKMRIGVLLKDGNSQVIKDGVVTFSSDVNGSFDVTSPTTDESGLVYVIFDPDDDTEAVDKSSTQSTYEGATITATYTEGVTATLQFNI